MRISDVGAGRAGPRASTEESGACVLHNERSEARTRTGGDALCVARGVLRVASRRQSLEAESVSREAEKERSGSPRRQEHATARRRKTGGGAARTSDCREQVA